MSGALSSLRILDFSTLLPGPYATMMLADMGAEVLRVESPHRLDLVRVLPPRVGKASAAHAYLNRGKKSLALDLKKPGAAEIVHRLVDHYDIVVEQFRPGVMDKLGVGYEALKAIRPDVIYCAITGYGQTGPYRDRAGHDLNYLSLSGVASYSHRADDSPCPVGIQVADVAGGSHHAVMAILAAVIHRQQAGEGQYLDISMTDAAFALNAMSAAGYLAGGTEPQAEREVLNGGGFYDYYETADGRFFSLAGLEPQFVKGLCVALGAPEMAATGLSQRPQDQAAFKAFLAEKLREDTFDAWCRFFEAQDVCVEPVLQVSEAVRHPQLVAREVVVDVPLAEAGEQAEPVEQPEIEETVKQPGFPIKFSRSPCQATHAGVALGAHSNEVLARLGYTRNDVEELTRNKVFG